MKNACNVILGAGGVKAIGQIGALRALQEEGWYVKNICGVSAGSIPAVFTAYNLSLEEMYNYALNENFYNYRTLNTSGLLTGLYKLDKLGLNVISKIENNSRVCNLHIATCSILSGQPVYFKNPTKEDLPTLIEASCAIPVIFRPIKHNDDYLVDGAVWQASPILYFEKTKYRHLPTFVISCNTEPSKIDKKILSSPFKIVTRSFSLVQSSYTSYIQKTIEGFKNIYFINYTTDIDIWELNPTIGQRKNVINNYYSLTKNILQQFS